VADSVAPAVRTPAVFHEGGLEVGVFERSDCRGCGWRAGWTGPGALGSARLLRAEQIEWIDTRWRSKTKSAGIASRQLRHFKVDPNRGFPRWGPKLWQNRLSTMSSTAGIVQGTHKPFHSIFRREIVTNVTQWKRNGYSVGANKRSQCSKML